MLYKLSVETGVQNRSKFVRLVISEQAKFCLLKEKSAGHVKIYFCRELKIRKSLFLLGYFIKDSACRRQFSSTLKTSEMYSRVLCRVLMLYVISSVSPVNSRPPARRKFM